MRGATLEAGELCGFGGGEDGGDEGEGEVAEAVDGMEMGSGGSLAQADQGLHGGVRKGQVTCLALLLPCIKPRRTRPDQPMQHPTHPRLHLRDAHDAHVVFEAVARRALPPITRRLNEAERRDLVRSGAVFVWFEAEDDSGLMRWTDGRSWGQSRMREPYLFYDEKTPYDAARAATEMTRGPAYRFIDGAPRSGPSSSAISHQDRTAYHHAGLVKQAYSAWVTLSDARVQKWHITAYFTYADLPNLPTIDHSRLRDIIVPAGRYRSSHSRTRSEHDKDDPPYPAHAPHGAAQTHSPHGAHTPLGPSAPLGAHSLLGAYASHASHSHSAHAHGAHTHGAHPPHGSQSHTHGAHTPSGSHTHTHGAHPPNGSHTHSPHTHGAHSPHVSHTHSAHTHSPHGAHVPMGTHIAHGHGAHPAHGPHGHADRIMHPDAYASLPPLAALAACAPPPSPSRPPPLPHGARLPEDQRLIHMLNTRHIR